MSSLLSYFKIETILSQIFSNVNLNVKCRQLVSPEVLIANSWACPMTIADLIRQERFLPDNVTIYGKEEIVGVR